MAGHPNSMGLQGLKPLFFSPLNVAAEAAPHKDTTHEDTTLNVYYKIAWFC
jgi:hypothetical protein